MVFKNVVLFLKMLSRPFDLNYKIHHAQQTWVFHVIQLYNYNYNIINGIN